MWTHFVHLPMTLALMALLVEALVSYPAPVYRYIGHPVTWIGWLISRLDGWQNRESDSFAGRKARGIVALLLLLLIVGGVALALTQLLAGDWARFALLVLLGSSLIAQRSLDEHVRAVAQALQSGGLAAGRTAVAMIVGRNPACLDEAGVARAAIESLAENFSDGIVAPLFWMVIGGLPGAALYKAANTADSMIGHKTPKYLAFGWAAARFDDLVNLPASRLCALWIVLAAVPLGTAGAAWRAVWRDAGHHRSPNAGWPEAAMAGALGLKLAGPRVYGEEMVQDVFMGDGRREAHAADILAALHLYRSACIIQALVLAVLVALQQLLWRA